MGSRRDGALIGCAARLGLEHAAKGMPILVPSTRNCVALSPLSTAKLAATLSGAKLVVPPAPFGLVAAALCS